MSYQKQTFVVNETETASYYNQTEINVRDHQHGVGEVGKDYDGRWITNASPNSLVAHKLDTQTTITTSVTSQAVLFAVYNGGAEKFGVLNNGDFSSATKYKWRINSGSLLNGGTKVHITPTVEDFDTLDESISDNLILKQSGWYRFLMQLNVGSVSTVNSVSIGLWNLTISRMYPINNGIGVTFFVPSGSQGVSCFAQGETYINSGNSLVFTYTSEAGIPHTGIMGSVYRIK